MSLSSKDADEGSDFCPCVLYLALWKDLLRSQKGVVSVNPIELGDTKSFIVTFDDPLQAYGAISGKEPPFSNVNVPNNDLGGVKLTCVPLDQTTVRVPEGICIEI